jgi:uncharacterized damage-inducible protein DinB
MNVMEHAVSESSMSVELRTLLRYLNAQRAHALAILEGLDDSVLRRPILPSGWTCLGLLQHLALDVERFWFRAVVAGEQAVIDELAGAPDAWQVGADVPAEAVFDRYRQETALANAIISATSLDMPPAWWPPDLFSDSRLSTVREVVLHVMTETACHTGHLDAARELIDGKLWLVLTD